MVNPQQSSVLGTMTPAVSGGALDDWINVIDEHNFLESAMERVGGMNKKFDTAMNLAIIGHTHSARIAVYDAPRKFFVLMDCGAWCERFRTSSEEVHYNCQMGVVCGNDLRIYQLEADPALPVFEKKAVL